jgi:hypothetical protein
MSEIQTTKLGRNWLLKTWLFTVLLLVFGFWGLADALYFYPRRGERDAAKCLKNHLVAAEEARVLTATQLKVTDPAATLAELRSRGAEIAARAKSDTADGRAARIELTRMEWLESLNKMWALRPEPRLVHSEKGPPPKKHYFDMRTGEGYTITGGSEKAAIPPRELLDLLTTVSNTTNQVTPLSGFDMLFQWVFVVIGFGGGAWMLLTLVRSGLKKYRWEPALQRLTLHDGRAITPADLADVDKRLWHKFFVTLSLRDGPPYKLDLLRYQPLEDWVLEMERTAFPDRAEPEAVGVQAGAPGADEPPPESGRAA